MVITMLKHFLTLTYPSFKIKNLKDYLSTSNIIEGFLIAILLSLFIYLSYFELLNEDILKIINSVSAILGFYLLLKADKKTLFWAGFFIGGLWFYWIGFSFRFYGVSYLIPIMMLFVSFGYGLFFWIIGIFVNPFARALLFLGFSFFHPLGFNWFIPELTLVNTLFGVYKWQFGLFLLSISLFIVLKSWQRIFGVLFLVASLNFEIGKSLHTSKHKIYLSSTYLSQDIKWEESYRQESIKNNLDIIKKAIKQNYDIVVLSESAFAMFLNLEKQMMNELKELSKEIIIVTGALYAKDTDAYNSTYYFINGEVKVADKVVLVPFGEEIPLPKFFKKLINDMFFNGAKDYKTALFPTDVEIKGEVFRNAICYEATREELYVGSPKLMIATSNNAWFTPSIQPTLQKILLKYFSIRYKTVIYHSANRGGTSVIY